MSTPAWVDRLVRSSKGTNYRTDLFWPMLEKVRSLTGYHQSNWKT
jgi:hypothetical protein